MISNTKTLVDRLGELKARIAELAEQESAVRAELVALGAGEYEGYVFRATVSLSERHTLDMEAVREKLSPQFITAHTIVTPTTTVRVVARMRTKLAA